MKDMVLATSYTSDIYMGLIGNTCFKGTPGVLKHYSGLPTANPGGPLKFSIALFLVENDSSLSIRGMKP